jgi:predicted NodU family carbamoyl transferase
MNILGISGLEQAMPFKRTHWPGLDARDYRISQGHDAAAALVVDGVPVAAAAEERFNRQKHSARFPACAILYCLDHIDYLFLDNVRVSRASRPTDDPVDETAAAFPYDAGIGNTIMLMLPVAPEIVGEEINDRVQHYSTNASRR